MATLIQLTDDGGYILAGWTGSNNGDVSGNHGSYDAWVVKLDNTGAIQWENALGGTFTEGVYDIQQAADGGYILVGWTDSNNGDVSGNHGGADEWVVKLDGSGTLLWQKTLGGTDLDQAFAICQAADGEYVIAGRTDSNDGDVSGNHGGWDAWLIKINDSGIIQWQKTLGGTAIDEAVGIQQSSDGGFVMTGKTSSNDGDVSGNHGDYDAWTVKIDGSGNIQWQNALGGTSEEWTVAIQQTIGEGYIIAGRTTSNDGDISGNHGSIDAWLAKLDSSGIIQWQKTLGGTGDDYAYAIQQTLDGGFITAGFASSNDGDVSGNHGDNDAWVVKLASDGTGIDELPSSGLALCPDPTTGPVSLTWHGAQGPYAVSILDATGRVLEVDHGIGSSCVLDLGGRQNGVYLIRVVYPDGTQAVKRIVKE